MIFIEHKTLLFFIQLGRRLWFPFLTVGAVGLLMGLGLVRVPQAGAPVVEARPGAFCDTVTEIPMAECEALVAFYNSTGGATTWITRTGWLATPTPCRWYGVTCNSNQVTHLILGQNGLSGTLPAALGNLPRLETLSLHQNQLTGLIPPELGALMALHDLTLSENQLTGRIPDQLSGLSNLRWLSLRNNRLSGSLPAWLGSLSQLESVHLSDNGFTGPIPTALGNLPSLKYLWLHHNSLSGPIPATLGNLTQLQELYLHRNMLSGSIPPELGRLAQLVVLHLGDNQLRGAIPPQLGDLGSVRALILSVNQLSGSIPPELGRLTRTTELMLARNQLTGAIPTELGNLSSLQKLALDTNQLSGSIPTSLGNLANLQYLWLHENQLSGTLPPQIGNLVSLRDFTLYTNSVGGMLPTSLGNLANANILNLSLNQFEGTIPAELGNLHTATELLLNSNRLTGPIPPALGNMASLQVLYLHENALTGSIPPALGRLSQLKVLHLGSNQLTGEIPSALVDLTALEVLFLWDNALTGSIPSQLGELSNLRLLGLSENQLSGPIPTSLGDLVALTELFLNNNQLTGTIPPELGNLTQLRILGIATNRLSGTIPTSLGTLVGLEELHLSRNQLTGGIPVELGNLTNLKKLALDVNQLSGSIPMVLGNLTMLTELYLHENNLSGPIPPGFGNLTQLERLQLGFNQLSGPIPAELGNLRQLQTLFLWGNQLEGPIPAELATLTELRFLGLSENRLTGTIPEWVGSLSHLQELSLSKNELTGGIPSHLGALSALRVLGLATNHLTGTIPTALGALSNLEQLYLDTNQLTGGIPTELGELRALQTLFLVNNGLVGDVPSALRNLTGLVTTDIGFNGLTVGDPATAAFLDDKDPDWANTQTVPPMGVTAVARSSGVIEVRWTPIRYVGDGGYYEISVATSAAGPYTVHGVTANKLAAGYFVGNLAPETTYFVSVRAFTPPHGGQHNAILSLPSAPASATTLPASAEVDPFEPNDSCVQANPISVDGVVQGHSFQVPGDSDWVTFEAISGTTYLIEARPPTHAPTDVMLELYGGCGGAATTGQAHAFTAEVRLRFVAPATGPISLLLRNTDTTRGSAEMQYHLSVRALDQAAAPGAAILVAGRLNPSDPLQPNIHHVTNTAYRLFTSQGYSPDRIFYLATSAQDADGDGVSDVDAALTSAALEQAITGWAATRVGPNRPLTIYLIDHGTHDQLYLDGASQIVRPQDLDQWLDRLEAAVPGLRVNVIVEACHAGSFIDRGHSVSQPGRVVIASTAAYALAYSSERGAFFSDMLLDALGRGASLYAAFHEARGAAQNAREDQRPWLDDDGDGLPNEAEDGVLAQRRGFTYAEGLPGEQQWPPSISQVQGTGNGEGGQLSALVQDDGRVGRVWAVIYAPSYRPPDPTTTETMPQENLPTVELTGPNTGGVYSVVLPPLTEVGRYRIVVYASDVEGLMAQPQQVIVNTGWSLYLPVARHP